RAIRAEFRLNERFEYFLKDIGTPLAHKRKGFLKLRDIFVYPDLSVRSHGPKSKVREVRGEEVLKFSFEADRVVFQSAALGGKTALAKILFSEMLGTAELLPLLLNGDHIKNSTERKVTTLSRKKFEEEYSPSMLEAFRQTEKDKRTLLVDDWHKAS